MTTLWYLTGTVVLALALFGSEGASTTNGLLCYLIGAVLNHD